MKNLTAIALSTILSTSAFASGDSLTMTNQEYYGNGVTSSVGFKPVSELEMGLTYDEQSRTLTWIGQINHLDFAKFSMLGWSEKPIDRLVIRSGGGMTKIGWAMAKFVEDNGITVEVAKQCDSACTLIALSSPNIEGWGTMGFHLPYLIAQAGSAADTTDVGYQMAMAGIEDDINSSIKFFEENKYISDELLERIKNETSSDILIDIDVKNFK